MTNSTSPMVECENLVKIYKTKEVEVVALQGLDLNIQKGELTAIIGSSGSGKSTLLNMLGGLDQPSAGILRVDGIDLSQMTPKYLKEYLLHTVGFVWQNNARNLIPYLTAVENIEMPMRLSKKKQRQERAMYLLESVGMAHRAKSKLGELSGGEQQRIAIALGLANQPKLLLADEPTGSVDSENTKRIMEVFRKVNKEEAVTVVIVTHDMELSSMVSRVINMRDGRTSSEFIAKEGYGEKALMNQKVTEIHETHEEWIVLDKVGRLQLPKKVIEELKLSRQDKLLLSVRENKIIIERGK